MKRLLIVRHGESLWNAEGRWQGWADIALSPRGEEQAKAAGERLGSKAFGVTFDAMIASDLGRAHQTALIINGYLGLPAIEPAPGLRERNVGEWTGLMGSEIEERWPEVIGSWKLGHPSEPPGGEPHADFAPRVADAILALFEAAVDEATLLAVSHGGVIRAIESHVGVHSERIDNLSGRWLVFEDGQITAGERFVL